MGGWTGWGWGGLFNGEAIRRELTVCWEFLSVRLTSGALAIFKWRVGPLQRCILVQRHVRNFRRCCFVCDPVNSDGKNGFPKTKSVFWPLPEPSHSFNLFPVSPARMDLKLLCSGGRERKPGWGGRGRRRREESHGGAGGCTWLFLIQEWYHRRISIADHRVLWAQCVHHCGQRGWEGKRPQLQPLAPSSLHSLTTSSVVSIFFSPSPGKTCKGPADSTMLGTCSLCTEEHRPNWD